MAEGTGRGAVLKRDWWIALWLVVATVFCTQTIFFDNASYVNLQQYASGHAPMPFQGRVAMMPLLRWAHSSPLMIAAAAHLDKAQEASAPAEKYTPEKLACVGAGLLSLMVIVGVCSWFGIRRHRTLWWLCPALALAVFFISYGARAEQNWWYPYDLPHAALFTVAAMAVLEGNLLLVVAAFVLDVPMRETALFILPCLLTVSYVRRQWTGPWLATAGLAVYWLAVRLAIRHAFRGNASETGFRFHQIFHSFSDPRHLPQLCSALGFLWLPLLLNLRRLSRVQRAFLLGALPGVIATGLLGIPYESRIWLEWSAVVACFVYSAFLNFLGPAQPA